VQRGCVGRLPEEKAFLTVIYKSWMSMKGARDPMKP